MNLEFILLGALSAPATGYDIKRLFDRVFSHFWAADAAQIYRTLKRLESKKLLKSVSTASDKGPDRRVYCRTRAGERALLGWLANGPVFGTERFTYLAQVFFLGQAADLSLSQRFLVGVRETIAARLGALEAFEAEWSRAPGYPDALDDVRFHRHLTLRMGLHKYRALIAWADESLARVRARTSAALRPEAAHVV
jgi:PadR family transcriptional regulator AphA